MATSLQVDVSTATTKQLLIAALGRLDNIHARLDQMETRMSELTDTVQALQGAVDGVAQRLLPKLAAAEEALAVATSDDAADDAAIAAALADAQEAVSGIRTEVDRLNALGADPSTPVDPEAPDAATVPDVEVPADGGEDVPADGGDVSVENTEPA